jgi:hypothetical protein
MEITTKSYKKINDFINKSNNDNNLEFELRFTKKNISNKLFENIFNKLTFSKLNNGLGFKYEMIKHLDIFLRNDNNIKSRMTLSNDNVIKKYWLGIDPADSDISLMEKEKIENYDDDDYNFRLSLNKELNKKDFLDKNKLLLKSNNSNKYYRLKNRYSIKSDDNLFSFDLSIVKQGYGLNLKQSKTLESNAIYEIEIEYNNKIDGIKNKTTEETSKKFVKYLYYILSIINNSNILLKNNVKDDIINNYSKLVGPKNSGDKFIAARPRTLHKFNLVKSDEKNLYNRYAVTLKADGVNYFMYVNTDGRIYYFNKNYEVEDSGYESKEYIDSLIEGEMVDFNGTKKFFGYDMLFHKGTDIRRKLLISLRKKDESYDESLDGRLDKLTKFFNSGSISLVKGFDKKNAIQYEKKPYEFSLRSDGSDIFDKIKKIWTNRTYNEFHVDGLIFVPIYEHYPLQGKTWDSLFKWKPPELNTIDFLIKFMRDENNNIINSPYIENVKRMDNKTERNLRLYRTLQLYVGGIKYDYNKINKKMGITHYPTLFNPSKINNININNNNSAKIFIDSEQKIFANDPLNGNIEEIYDDTIVECSYNIDADNGFNWVPIRNRMDKTSLYKKGENGYCNNEKVANDIFNSIKNPVTEDIIMSGKVDITDQNYIESTKSYFADLESNHIKKKRYPFQNFHRLYIKTQLLYFTSSNYLMSYTTGMHGKFLDGCCGKGVDITLIKNAGYAEVVGIEYDQDSVKYSISHYKSQPRPKPKAFYVRGDLSKLIFPNQSCGFTESDKIYTKKFIPKKNYFNTMSLMFCIHYFFKDEISLRTIIQNISDNLEIDGYFIGTCFNGEKIHKQMKNEKQISGKTYDGEVMWKIEKKYKGKLAFGPKNPNLGKQIDVYVQSIGNVHEEYLVNFEYFEKMMNEYGFEKILIKSFEDFYDEVMKGENKMKMSEDELLKIQNFVKSMSEEEKRFSFLNSAFIFKKVEHSSDKLYKKLVELIDKKSKIKNSDISAVTQEDSEIMILDEKDE